MAAGRQLTLVRIAILGLGIVAGLLADVQQGAFEYRPVAFVVADLLGGWSFLVAGTIAWQRRPSNRIGPLLVASGLAWFVGSFGLIGGDTSSHLARSFQGWWEPLLAWVVLAYPTGLLASRSSRGLIGGWLLVQASWTVARLILERPLSWYACPTCRDTADAFIANSRAVDALGPVVVGATVVLALLVVASLVIRALGARPATRRRLLPAVLAGVVLGLNVAVTGAVRIGPVPALFADGRIVAASYVLDMLVAIAVLVGLLQDRLAREAIAQLVIDLEVSGGDGRRRTRDALARALNEPTLDLLFDDGAGGQVDVDGRPAPVPDDSPGRAVTRLVAANGMPVGVLVHDPGLLDDPSLVAGLTAALRLETENRRLAAQVDQQLHEVRASRSRIVAAGDAERRRVERDLHDGAQQRLLALSMEISRLRLAAERSGDEALRDELASLGRQLEATISELRELARGIVPGILGDAGLAAAIESLALRSAVAVTTDVQLSERLPREVETAAYFVIAEALTNIARHAGPASAKVTIARSAGELHVTVEDDGVGGADISRGSGLQGLADRVGAIDGRLTVQSEAGSGTRLVAVLPVPS